MALDNPETCTRAPLNDRREGFSRMSASGAVERLRSHYGRKVAKLRPAQAFGLALVRNGRPRDVRP